MLPTFFKSILFCERIKSHKSLLKLWFSLLCVYSYLHFYCLCKYLKTRSTVKSRISIRNKTGFLLLLSNWKWDLSNLLAHKSLHFAPLAIKTVATLYGVHLCCCGQFTCKLRAGSILTQRVVLLDCERQFTYELPLV